jgi:epoxide hydrolase 4
MPIQTPLEHTTIHTNGVNLQHGFPEFWYSWRNQIDALAAAGFRLIIPDQRGYNLSDKPKDAAAYNLDEVSADVIGLIDHFGLEKIDLIAHDWGGAAAWWTANKYPERIHGLAVLNVPHHRAFGDALRKSASQRRKSLYMRFFQMKTLPELLIRFGNGMLLARWAFRGTRAFTPEDIRLYQQAWMQPDAATGMLNWYRAGRASKLGSWRITVPTLLIWGKGDFAFSPELAPASIDYCDDGRYVYLDHATHWVQHDAPKEVNRLLIEWLRDGIVSHKGEGKL